MTICCHRSTPTPKKMHLEMKENDKMQINIMNQNKNSPNPLFNVENSSRKGDPTELNDNDLEEGEILITLVGGWGTEPALPVLRK